MRSANNAKKDIFIALTRIGVGPGVNIESHNETAAEDILKNANTKFRDFKSKPVHIWIKPCVDHDFLTRTPRVAGRAPQITFKEAALKVRTRLQRVTVMTVIIKLLERVGHLTS
jgi:hypothetical protein